MKAEIRSILTVLLLVLVCTPVYSQLTVDLESGAVVSGYNDVRIPGDGGTLFSLSEELEIDPTLFYRIRLFYAINERHNLGILYAPLSLNPKGTLNKDLVFQEETFAAGTPLDATYRFNSYRLVYLYDFLMKEKLELGIGFTAKIRDAEISVRGNGVESKKTNVGFVPIIHFHLLWHMTPRLGLLVDGDALAAPQGRAEDVLAAFTYKFSDTVTLKLGYRLLEGGADNDEVYNFSLINYACFGVLITM